MLASSKVILGYLETQYFLFFSQNYLDKKLYTNRPTVHYFTQFSTSSR